MGITAFFSEATDSPLAQPERQANCLLLGLCKGTVKESKFIEAEWHIYASVNYTIIGSDYGLLPDWCQAIIIRTNARILLIGPLGTNFSEILIKIHTFNFKKMPLKMSSGNWWPFCLSLNVLTCPISDAEWRCSAPTKITTYWPESQSREAWCPSWHMLQPSTAWPGNKVRKWCHITLYLLNTHCCWVVSYTVIGFGQQQFSAMHKPCMLII